jgi:hypothetical protein
VQEVIQPALAAPVETARILALSALPVLAALAEEARVAVFMLPGCKNFI